MSTTNIYLNRFRFVVICKNAVDFNAVITELILKRDRLKYLTLHSQFCLLSGKIPPIELPSCVLWNLLHLMEPSDAFQNSSLKHKEHKLISSMLLSHDPLVWPLMSLSLHLLNNSLKRVSVDLLISAMAHSWYRCIFRSRV